MTASDYRQVNAMACDIGVDVRPHVDGVARIVVLRANGLGDYLFAEPALAALKRAYPDAELVLLGAPWHAAELACRPGLPDRVLVVPPYPGIREPVAGEDGYARESEMAEWTAAASRERFDLALQMHGGGRNSNPLVRALGARVTAGLATEDAQPLDRTLPYYYFQPEVFRFLEVAALVGADPVRCYPSWTVTAADRTEALGVIGDAAGIAVLAPGAGDGRRRWNPSSFARVGDELASRGLDIVAVGAEDERALVEGVRSEMRAPSTGAAGTLSIGGLGAVLERARVVVANDSGTLHLARACGAATVGVYWCGNLINAGPLVNARHRVALSWRLDCPVCGENCMGEGCTHDASFVDDVTVDQVLRQAIDLAGTETASNPAAQYLTVAGTASA